MIKDKNSSKFPTMENLSAEKRETATTAEKESDTKKIASAPAATFAPRGSSQFSALFGLTQ